MSPSPGWEPQKNAKGGRQVHLHAIARYCGLYRFDHFIWPGRECNGVSADVKQNFLGPLTDDLSSLFSGPRRSADIMARYTLERGFCACCCGCLLGTAAAAKKRWDDEPLGLAIMREGRSRTVLDGMPVHPTNRLLERERLL
jgi:hypothetical protein